MTRTSSSFAVRGGQLEKGARALQGSPVGRGARNPQVKRLENDAVGL